MSEPDAVSEEKSKEAEWAVLKNRPDPLFLHKTKRLAERFGLKFVEAKLPQTLIADFILNVPEGLNLSETLFDFFRTYSGV